MPFIFYFATIFCRGHANYLILLREHRGARFYLLPTARNFTRDYLSSLLGNRGQDFQNVYKFLYLLDKIEYMLVIIKVDEMYFGVCASFWNNFLRYWNCIKIYNKKIYIKRIDWIILENLFFLNIFKYFYFSKYFNRIYNWRSRNLSNKSEITLLLIVH